MNSKEIWDTLMGRQWKPAVKHASKRWLNGLPLIGLSMPDPMNQEITIGNDWKVIPILGKSSEVSFWYKLSRGAFNVNVRLRDANQINYLEERDLFHDYFGHLPILINKHYTDYLLGLGIYAQHMHFSDPVTFNSAKKAISNIYWFTSEFGLVMEDGELKAYGAGILSSVDELNNALSGDSKKIHLTQDNLAIELSKMTKRNYITNEFQDIYYVLTNWSLLTDMLKWLWKKG